MIFYFYRIFSSRLPGVTTHIFILALGCVVVAGTRPQNTNLIIYYSGYYYVRVYTDVYVKFVSFAGFLIILIILLKYYRDVNYFKYGFSLNAMLLFLFLLLFD